MTDDQVERELQFECADLDAVERWIRAQPTHAQLRFRPSPAKTQRDIYMDTADWALYRAGFSLRIRSKPDGSEATLKALARRRAGPLSRREISESLEHGSSGLEAAAGGVSERVKLMTGVKPVDRLFEIETERRVVTIERPAGEQPFALAEICLDSTRVVVDGQPSRPFSRVEVEEKAAGGLDDARGFVEAMTRACQLTPATTSKYEEGLAAADLHPELGFELGYAELSGDATAGEYAYALLRGYLNDVLRHEPGTRLGEDPEELHDMRVAIRKTRAAIGAFKAALPLRFQVLRDELKWIGGCLGEVRDMDVQLEWLEELRGRSGWEEATAVGPLIAERRERRSEERGRLLEALDSERYTALMRDLAAALREGDPGKGDAALPVREFGARLLKRRYRQFEREADAVTPESEAMAYHAARIRAKRLRYAADALAPVYGRRAAVLIGELKALQDLLGEHQDSAVAIDWLKQTALSGRDWPAPTLVRAGELMERQRQRMAELRQAFPAAYDAVEKRWPALRRATRKASRGGDDVRDHEEESELPVRPPVQRPLSIFRRFFGRSEN